jgi:hypothetical protein
MRSSFVRGRQLGPFAAAPGGGSAHPMVPLLYPSQVLTLLRICDTMSDMDERSDAFLLPGTLLST